MYSCQCAGMARSHHSTLDNECLRPNARGASKTLSAPGLLRYTVACDRRQSLENGKYRDTPT
jgi:hypothetical protein